MPNTSAAPDKSAVTKLYEIFLAGEYAAVHRLIDESAMAPAVADGVALIRLMGSEIAHLELLAEQVTGAGGTVDAAITAHRGVFDRYHRVTTPSTWLEVLVKLYLSDGMVADFYAEMVETLPGEARKVFREVLAHTASSQFARDEVRAAVEADPAIAAPLTLWGRRLLGEAITHMQWVLAEDDDVTDLLFASTGSLATATAFFDAIAERHTERMAELGLG
ncbi:ferritin-like domain-containing protein [Gordonia sp. PP30]|uniref:ferritin-like fold-containing protein n=1 Tax=Gordonia sp. PP30 TaxID=2935861 RepID=UPI001FFE54DD|nr:ferritin-like fold-containing protein [Gordonia sp. PP30]UQE74311.1 ferritin-like domain-containing protein [Gordonia sp. PP30]